MLIKNNLICIQCYNSTLFSYCCEVWNVLGETQPIRLQLHNRAARTIVHVPNEINEKTALNILVGNLSNNKESKNDV